MNQLFRSLGPLFLTFLFLGHGPTAEACTIFLANDGTHVWVGNNEDELQSKRYRMWYYPARKSAYGYAIWTELSFGRLLNGFSYLNPQGGLNEFGLFLDFTAIDQINLVQDDGKTNRKKQVVTDLLRTCKTVDEALTWLNRYNLVKLDKAQLFLADSTGNYATVTGGYVVPKTETNFALTNYCLKGGCSPVCHRQAVATSYLRSTARFEKEDVRNLLEKSAQKPPNNLISNYSMAIDLRTRTIYLYYQTDFSTNAVISLSLELSKGRHQKDMDAYFPLSIAPEIERVRAAQGLTAALDRYHVLRLQDSVRYRFSNNDAMNLAIGWLEKGRNNDAIQLLQCLAQSSPEKADLQAWLGVAYRKESDSVTSNQYFANAFRLYPRNYIANLFGRQVRGTVFFRLPDFEGAQKVSLMGDFSGWTRNPIPMTRVGGTWVCSVELPPGEVVYKFLVNDQYLADSQNFLHVGTGPDVFSKLYVW